MKKFITALSASLTVILMVLIGCSTNQVTTAYKVEGATDIAVRAAMSGWNLYVGMKHPGTNAELQVMHAFKTVQAAEVTVVDATASLAANPTNTAPLLAAQNAFSASIQNLNTLITTITNK